ncbi:putative transcription factor bHLH041 [Nymphaea colorata]|nr:putative transcription factor bHLH041 [Nymphaea colorata]XP_049934353.1 putative transcription factor bHLH041 [Nymphaea colorata]
MDLVFMLEEESRSAFIRWVVQNLGCRYICLWSYQPYLPKCMLCTNGWYEEDKSTAEASWLRQELFDTYRGSVCVIENGGIPGLAFTEGKAYLRLGEASLQSMARTDTQRQFYQGAGIKTAVFLACRSGEVEIGSSSGNINLEMEEIRSLLTGELFKQFQSVNPAHPLESSRASSSSSSLLSFSIGSPEYSSMLINLPNPQSFQESIRNQASILRSTTSHPHPYALPPATSMEDAAVTKAMLAVLSSSVSPSPASSSPSSSSSSPSSSAQLSTQTGAFRKYSRALSPSRFIRKSSSQSQNLQKLSVIILRGINQQRLEAQLGANKPASSQLSHVMSERKRREKLNESFLALRALLPLGTKRDKASVLTSTREYMIALREQVRELESRNRVLEAQMFLLPTSNGITKGREDESSAGEGREEIKVVEVSSALDEREIELIVHKQIELTYLVLKLLGCIKDMGNVALLAVTADVQKVEQQQRSSVALRLKIMGKDWSKRDFEERISREFGG